MGKVLKIIAVIISVIAIATIAYKVNISNYEKRADERINEVIQLQGTSIENGDVLVDAYDSKQGCWYKRIVFEDDPDIPYDYEFYKSDNQVRIFAMYNNMSLDLAHKKAKYPVYDVNFEKDKIKEIIER